MTIVLSVLFGAVVGVALGALGGGGSILVVPALVYGLAVSPVEATKLSQVIVGATSLVAAGVHWRAGRTQVSTAIVLAVTGIAGAVGGRIACRSASDTVIMLSLAVLLVTTASLMLRRSFGTARPADADERAPRGLASRIALTTASGMAVGFLTGFLGVGGGFLIVPVLLLILRVPMKSAVGTSLLVIALNCATSLAYDGVADVRWDLALPFIIGAVAASIAGTAIAHRVPSTLLQRGFAIMVIVLGLVIMAGTLIGS